MKLVPAFFLFALSITRLIYLIADPGVPKAALEKLKTRRAAAMIRFYRSKRYTPMRFPLSYRDNIAANVWKYVKYIRIMAKRFFLSTKARFGTRFVDFRGVVFKYIPSGQRRKQLFHCDSQGNKYCSIRAPVHEKQVHINEGAAKQPNRRTTAGVKKPHKWPVLKITASAYETFKHVAQQFLSRIQGVAIMRVPKNMTPSLSDICFQVGVISHFAERMAMIFRTVSQEPQAQLFRKQQEHDLVLSTYILVPFAALSNESSPETCPQTAAEQGLEQTPQVRYIKASASPEATRTSLDNVIMYPGPVETFRRLARVVAKA